MFSSFVNMNKTAQCQEKYVTASSFIITKLPFLSSPLPIKPCIASNLSGSPKLEKSDLIRIEQIRFQSSERQRFDGLTISYSTDDFSDITIKKQMVTGGLNQESTIWFRHMVS
ncbi:MAG: hypothetical protein HXM80_04820 [Neisseria sicca]|uniref:Uncharacterized protein n=1 Tax=Neisseria sicca TaxID=490 RepID=A0A930GVS3_NEISI|nr:hypothetical protein [Neisseria mucosa]MBF1265005.1 hypothetical protein [Neisseria sicca]